MEVEVKIVGMEALEARLQEIDALAGRRLLTRILRWVAQPLEDRAKRNAYGISKHGSSGALARSIAIVVRKPLGNQVARVSVTPKKDPAAIYLHNAFYRRKRKGIFYGWMLERGHAIGTGRLSRSNTSLGFLRHYQRGGAMSKGQVAGRPWFQPAVSASTGQMTSDFVKYLTVALSRIEKRTGKTPTPEGLVP